MEFVLPNFNAFLCRCIQQYLHIIIAELFGDTLLKCFI